jgi:endonuclease IV
MDHVQVLLFPDRSRDGRVRLEAMAAAGVPVILHAPHHLHGLNLSGVAPASLRDVEDAMTLTLEAADLLGARAIVLHAGEYPPGGRDAAVAAFSGFLDRFRDPRYLLENLPPCHGEMRMLGCTAPELEGIAGGRVEGYCLDFAHLHCTASASGHPFRELLAAFSPLPVGLHHLSGTPAGSPVDGHLPLDHPENGLDLPAVTGWIRAHGTIPTSLELHGAGAVNYRRQAGIFARLMAAPDMA